MKLFEKIEKSKFLIHKKNRTIFQSVKRIKKNMQIEQPSTLFTNNDDDVSRMMGDLMKQCFNDNMDNIKLPSEHRDIVNQFCVKFKDQPEIKHKIKLHNKTKKQESATLCAFLICLMMSMVKPKRILVLTKTKTSVDSICSQFEYEPEKNNCLSETGLLKKDKQMLFASFFKCNNVTNLKQLKHSLRNSFVTVCPSRVLENAQTHFIEINDESTDVEVPNSFVLDFDCVVVYGSETLAHEERVCIKNKFKNVIMMKHQKK